MNPIELRTNDDQVETHDNDFGFVRAVGLCLLIDIALLVIGWLAFA